MSKLDAFLAYAESNRLVVSCIAGFLTVCIAWLDWRLFDVSIGFLYLIPILFAAPALNHLQIGAFGAICGYLTEALDPVQGTSGKTGWELIRGFNPFVWAPGTTGRLLVAVAGELEAWGARVTSETATPGPAEPVGAPGPGVAAGGFQQELDSDQFGHAQGLADDPAARRHH